MLDRAEPKEFLLGCGLLCFHRRRVDGRFILAHLSVLPRVLANSNPPNEETTTIRYGVRPLACERRTRHCGSRWLFCNNIHRLIRTRQAEVHHTQK
jgi:hypothetical protein